MLHAFAWSPDVIWSVGKTGFWMLIMLGVLVSFHELGHFLAARWVGVRVLKFSLGFGPKLAGRQVGETEYLLSAIPLGGYVKLFGEDESEALTPEDQRRSFAHQRLPGKFLIVAAGPGFNFILAYVIFFGWLATGAPLFVPTFHDLTPDVEALRPGSPAVQAGIQVGDRIVRVNENEVSTRSEVLEAIGKSRGQAMTLDIRRGDQVKTVVVTPVAAPGSADKGDDGWAIGIEETAPVITSVMVGSPAMTAGFKDGDRVVRIENQPIQTWSQMTAIVKESPGRPLQFEVERGGQPVTLMVIPLKDKAVVDGKTVEIGKIGISGPGRAIVRASNPLTAAWRGVEATWGWSELTLVGVYKMIVGEISRSNIGGPLTIAKVSGEAAEQGFSSYVFLIAILSINLGVLNLLPIPILDGGHLLFFAIEAVLRKPLGERQREIAQQVGLVLLVGIMVFAFWNDIARIVLPLFRS